jgi:hypothetical protein
MARRNTCDVNRGCRVLERRHLLGTAHRDDPLNGGLVHRPFVKAGWGAGVDVVSTSLCCQGCRVNRATHATRLLLWSAADDPDLGFVPGVIYVCVGIPYGPGAGDGSPPSRPSRSAKCALWLALAGVFGLWVIDTPGVPLFLRDLVQQCPDLSVESGLGCKSVASARGRHQRLLPPQRQTHTSDNFIRIGLKCLHRNSRDSSVHAN